MISNSEIQKLIPHRYPFLLVDKVLEVEEGKYIKALKNVTANEPHFQGHFPGYPIMPGVLIIEALAQTAGICICALDNSGDKIGVLASVDGFKFKKQVMPGDTLILEAEILMNKMGVVKAKVKATVDDKEAASGEVKFAMVSTEG